VATLAGDSFTAQAIEIKSEELAYGYAKLAQNDPRVKHVLQMLLEGSAWAEALIPTIGLLIVVGWHHGYVPDQIGVPFTVANGMMPVSRSMEKKMREQAQQDQSDAAGKPRPDKNGSGDGGNPTT
jgi:hypothetical protein